MKQAVILSIAGFFIVIVFVSVFNISNASESKSASNSEGKSGASIDERAKSISDTTVSGRKTEVPLVKDMDESIRAKEKELKEKERVLQEKEEAIAVEDQRVKQRIDELEELQAEVMKYQKKNSESSEAQLKRLVKTIESMNPKKAAAMFGTMKDDLAVELMMNMKEKKVAGVLDLLDPERANLLSIRMAQRRPAGRATGEVGQTQSKRSPSP